MELHARPPRSLLGNISHGGTSAGTCPLPFGAAPDLWSLDTLSPAERGALTGDKRMLSNLNCGCLPTGEGSDEETVVQCNHQQEPVVLWIQSENKKRSELLSPWKQSSCQIYIKENTIKLNWNKINKINLKQLYIYRLSFCDTSKIYLLI